MDVKVVFVEFAGVVQSPSTRGGFDVFPSCFTNESSLFLRIIFFITDDRYPSEATPQRR